MVRCGLISRDYGSSTWFPNSKLQNQSSIDKSAITNTFGKGVSVTLLSINLTWLHCIFIMQKCSDNNTTQTHPFFLFFRTHFVESIPFTQGNGNFWKPVEDAFTLTVPRSVLHTRIVIPLRASTISHTIQIGASYPGEAGSDAGRRTVQGCTVCGPAFWWWRVDELGPTSRCKLHQGHECGSPPWNSRWGGHKLVSDSLF